MSTTPFKNTFAIGGDMTVNRMGFGAMRITGQGIWGQPENKPEAIRVLQRAVELGVNFIDTADSYGPNVSEELIAEALYPYSRDLIIGTKGGLLRGGPDQWSPDGGPAHLRSALEGSLKRLKQERIDLYQLHRIDPKVPAEETFRFLQEAQKEGKIRHIGLSEVSVENIKKAQQYFNVVSVQNMYSVDNRKWEDVLNYCTEHKIAFIPWYPLGAGSVKNQSILQKIAVEHNVGAQQIALSWLLHHAENILLIPGTSKTVHLEQNIKAAEIRLSEANLRELNTLANATR